MTLKSKLPSFLSGTTDPAGETLGDRTVMDSDAEMGDEEPPFALPLLGHYPVSKQLQILGGALLLVMLIIAVVVYRDDRQSTYGTAYIAAAGDMGMLSQRLAKASSLALLGDPAAFKQLRDSRDSFVTSLDRLINGGELGATLVPASPASVHPQLLFLSEAWAKTDKNAGRLLEMEKNLISLGKDVAYSVLSKPLPIPNHTETLEIARLGGLDAPVLKVTQGFGDARKVSAFAPMVVSTPQGLLVGLRATTTVRLSLADGTEVMTAGDANAFGDHGDTEFVTVEAFAGELPLKVTATVPFAIVRADYSDLDASFTVLCCLMCGAFLALTLHYVRRSDVPAFDLERAIAAGELKPYYQPVINLRTGALAGCEVLCRWEKKSGEGVPPGAFIET